MKKIRLDLDVLRVESFGTTKEKGARGTVHAHTGGCVGWSAGPTGCGEWTCLNYGSCDPYAECLHTGNLPTCGTAGC